MLEVLERDGVTAGCPVASRVPYELLIAPSRPEAGGLESDLLAPALRLLAELVRRLQRIRGEALVPLNAWLHDGPHWHLEVFPRTTTARRARARRRRVHRLRRARGRGGGAAQLKSG